MKKILNAVVWSALWVVMVVEQVPVVKGADSAPRQEEANRQVPKHEGKVYRLEEMVGEEGVEMRSQILFGQGLGNSGGKADGSEDEALVEALKNYRKERQKALERFLAEHPKSRWAAGIKYRLGLEYRKAGYLSQALGILEEAWKENKGSGKQAQEIVAELVDLNARFGRKERLQEILGEIEGWEFEGRAKELISGGRQGLWAMENRPEDSFKCGPMALYRLREKLGIKDAYSEKIEKEESSKKGISLKRVNALASELGMGYQMAYREAGACVIVPAVVHWKADHYAAVTAESAAGMYEVEDPTFGGVWYASKEALEKEGSGYYLVPEGTLPAGWRAVSEKEGKGVWGKGTATAFGYNKNKPAAVACGGGQGGGGEGTVTWIGGQEGTKATGMPQYQFHAMLCGLSIRDVPVGYDVARGPGVPFGLTYTQREPRRIPKYEYSSGEQIEASPLGSKWAFDWESYVHVQAWPPGFANNEVEPSQTVEGFHGPEGIYRERLKVEGAGAAGNLDGKADRMVGSPGIMGGNSGYERVHADGSKEVYGFKEGLITPCTLEVSAGGSIIALSGFVGTEKYYLSKLVDAHGNETVFNYDSDIVQMDAEPEVDYPNNEDWVDVAVRVKLRSVVDSTGKVSEYGYYSESQADKEAYYRVKEVVDPYGRKAQFGYDGEWQLASITDAVGLKSEFEREGEFIKKMVTPYGTTNFEHGENYGAPNGNNKPRMGRYVQATDGAGTQKLEYVEGRYVNPGEAVPVVGAESFEPPSEKQTTFFWDRKAWAEHPGDYTKAHMIRWLKQTDAGAHVISEYKQSEKSALGSRVWYKYPGQGSIYSADGIKSGGPSLVAQVIDGVTHYVKREYNELGNVTKMTDAAGRVTTFEYAANKIDLVKVRVFDGNSFQEVKSITYNSAHEPVSMTDADGQTTTINYNNFGQVISVTDPELMSTMMSYDNATGYLTGINPPGDESMSMTYDKGQVHTVSDQDGYTVTTEHDALGRVTKVSYPDGSSEEVIYERLDPTWVKDRSGKWSSTYYASAGQPSVSQDSNGNVTQFEWCTCGSLEKIIDAKGNATTWVRDLEGRVTGKVYANGKSESIEYNEGGQVKKATDIKGGAVTTSYNADGTVASLTLKNIAADVTQVNLSYDPHFSRVTSRTEVGGANSKVTTYTYKDIGQPGAGSISILDGPGGDDTISYDYDNTGRVVSYSINGIANSFSYGSYGRLDSRSNALGTFNNQYDGGTSLLKSVQYPNGVSKVYGYESIQEGQRLKSIAFTGAAGNVLAKHEYSRDVLGQVSQWTQTAAGNIKSWKYEQDATGQLLGAIKSGMGVGNPIEKEWHWGYDAAGNRQWEQEDAQVKSFSYNVVNELGTIQGGSGYVRMEGEVSEAAKVEIAGKVVHTDGSKLFQAEVPVSSGVNTVAVKMSNASGEKTRQVQLTVSGSGSESLSYDENGNLLSDGSKTYEWDGCNRLKKVKEGNQTSEFSYDGEGRMVGLIEKDNGNVTETKEFLWLGDRLVREKGAIATKNFFSQGFEVVQNGTSTKYYYGKDHLGSIREVLDFQGNVVTRYDYTPYGERTKLSGSIEAPFGFTGHYFHEKSGLHLTRFRVYDAKNGRWLSRDPIQEAGGLNLYAYVGNNPVNKKDPLGLWYEPPVPLELGWLIGGVGGGLFYTALANFSLGPAAGFSDPAQNMATWGPADNEQTFKDAFVNKDWSVEPITNANMPQPNSGALWERYLIDLSVYDNLPQAGSAGSGNIDKCKKFIKDYTDNRKRAKELYQHLKNRGMSRKAIMSSESYKEYRAKMSYVRDVWPIICADFGGFKTFLHFGGRWWIGDDFE